MVPDSHVRLEGEGGLRKGSGAGDQPETLRHPQDVGVHGEGGHAEGEQEQDVRRLHAHPGEGGEVLPRLGKRHPTKEVEGVAAPLLPDPRQRAEDRLRLRLGEPAHPDRLLELRRSRGGKLGERGKTFRQAVVRAVAVGVGGVLRKDRQDEVADRLPLVGAEFRPAEPAGEQAGDLAKTRGKPADRLRHQPPLRPGDEERPAAPRASGAPRAAVPNTRSVLSRAARPPPRRAPTAPALPPRPAHSSPAWRRVRSRGRTAAGNGGVSARFRKRGDRSWNSSGRKRRRPAGFPLEIADLGLELPDPSRRGCGLRPAAEGPRESRRASPPAPLPRSRRRSPPAARCHRSSA